MNSAAPYSHVQEGLEYSFETDSGIRYLVYFSAIDLIDDVPMWWFGFKQKGGSLLGYDSRIRATVVHILRTFFELHNDAVVFVCSPSEGKGAARYRLFNLWFELYGDGYEKYDLSKYDIYGALICRVDFPDKIIAKNFICDFWG